MAIGVSSACFYPLETDKSLEEIGKLGIKTAEIFFNSHSELSKEYLKRLNDIKSFYSVKTPSVHPFTSGCESFFLFSRYKKRFYETAEYYKKYFNAANEIGAEMLVIHGARFPAEIEDEEYFERFQFLIEEGKEFNVDVVQENVYEACASNPKFLKEMKKYLGKDFKINFDIKQMKKCSFKISDFFPEFSESVVNFHVSDNNKTETCMLPGEGTFDFENLFSQMKKSGYNGNYIIELYRQNFKTPSDILKAYDYLIKKSNNVENLNLL